MKTLALLLTTTVLLASGCGGDAGGDESAPETEQGAAGEVPFDRAFIDAVVPHHESAIEMAREAKGAGLAEPELLQIADDIIATQQQEIDQMLAWRTEWFGSSELGSEVQAVEALGLTMEEAGMAHAGELSEADDVDAAFAAMMIAHHEGAIRMAKLAEERAGHDEIKQLARNIIAAQQREIEVMEEHADHHGS